MPVLEERDLAAGSANSSSTKGASKGNFFIALIKGFLFLLIFCFALAITQEFSKELNGVKGLQREILLGAMLAAFLFYTFIADLNEVYKKIQNFFYHGTFLAQFIPSLFILLGVGYFVLPKIFHLDFNKDIFVFSGGFVLMCHLIYVARETRGTNFSGFMHYFFIFSILYLINLILFGAYLKIAFDFALGKTLLYGSKAGAILIKSLFTKIS
jgi:hypothetical protein